MPHMPGSVQVNLDLAAELRDQLKERAKVEGINFKALVVRALEKELKKAPPKKPKKADLETAIASTAPKNRGRPKKNP